VCVQWYLSDSSTPCACNTSNFIIALIFDIFLRSVLASVLHELDVGQPKRNEIETLCEVGGGFHFRHLLL
jgi:hypothetical protein